MGLTRIHLSYRIFNTQHNKNTISYIWFSRKENLPGGPGGPGGPSIIPVGNSSPLIVVVSPLSPLSPLSPWLLKEMKKWNCVNKNGNECFIRCFILYIKQNTKPSPRIHHPITSTDMNHSFKLLCIVRLYSSIDYGATYVCFNSKRIIG